MESAAFAGTPLADDFAAEEGQRLDVRMRRVLLKGGTVLSLDPEIGGFVEADVLIEGQRIAAVEPAIEADATTIDARGMIVMPGLVDAHRHLWSGMFRRSIPDADGAVYSNLANTLIPLLSEEDVYHATRLADAACMHSGVTTMLDYAHVSKAPEICDAGIRAHLTSGLRVVYAYAPPRSGPSSPEFPEDVERIRNTFFSSDDQLVTLRLGTRLVSENYALARRLGLGITCDGVFGLPTPLRPNSSSARLLEMADAGELGPDVTIIHATGFPDPVVKALGDAGACIVLAPTSDSTLRGLGNSLPPIQGILDHGLVDRTGISVDIEVSLSTDLFAQMRAIFIIQRLTSNMRWAAGDAAAPPNITVRQVLTMATVGGARASGVFHKVGTLTPEKDADIVMIRANDIMTAPLNHAPGTVVIGAGVEQVDTVFIEGRLKKWRGNLVGVDESALIEHVRASRDRLAERSGVWSMRNIID